MNRGTVTHIDACTAHQCHPIREGVAAAAMGNEQDELTTMVLRNAQGVEVHIHAGGAAIQRVLLPDRDGNKADVVLGFDSAKPYVDGSNPYFGVVVGRCANRISNACFRLGDRTHCLTANDPPNSLHGGAHGWGEKVWDAERVNHGGSPAIRLTYSSADGEEGYPGNVDAVVVYVLSDGSDGSDGSDSSTGRLRCLFSATTDACTPINMVQHSYWNLKGHASGNVLDHTLSVCADYFTPVDVNSVPTGQLVQVAETALDFRVARQIGSEISNVAGGGGYDHNFVLRKGPESSDRVQLAAVLRDTSSGRSLTVHSNAPGLQVYSGNFLDGSAVGKDGIPYARHSGVALESQGFPNSVNTPSFPSVVVRPGETYRHEVLYQFGL